MKYCKSKGNNSYENCPIWRL